MPSIVGEYEVLGQLGKGGMGVVYRARHRTLKRDVALKMILAGPLATPAELARFRTEAENIAALKHPHIVPIYQYDTYLGQPYYSMELIEEGSLARHLTRFREDLRTAAQLLITVAEAVHHAHQRGILHRDLKPANILLDEHGQPHLTDFGLAKPLSREASNPSSAVLGTPGYMAPEQVDGGRHVSVAADVHGLGAVLYELLTGRPPYQADTPLATTLQVLEQEPQRPRSLNPAVDPDLETICLKCLRKEPPKRYASARELADDLRRYLAGEPILARRVSRLERGVKWARRRPTLTALLTVSVLALAALVAGAAYHYRQLHLAFANVRDARDRTRLAVLLLTLDERNEMDNARQGELLDQLSRDASDAPELRLAMGQVLNRQGNRHRDRGDNEAALEAHRWARDVFVDLVRRYPEEPRYRLELACCYHNMGLAYAEGRQLTPARAHYDRALKQFEELAEEEKGAIYRRHLAHALGNRAVLEQTLGEPRQARVLYHRVAAMLESLPSKEARDWQNLARTWNNLAGLYHARKEAKDHVGALEKALAIRRRLHSAAPKVPAYQRDLAESLYNLAGWYALPRRSVDELIRAEQLYEEAAGLYRQVIGPRVGSRSQGLQDSGTLVQLLLSLGSVYDRRGKPDAVQRCYHEALSVADQRARAVLLDVAARTQLLNLAHFLVRWSVDNKRTAQAHQALGPVVKAWQEAAQKHRDDPDVEKMRRQLEQLREECAQAQ
jgi:tetratricopeptide (TPR) repeat protein